MTDFLMMKSQTESRRRKNRSSHIPAFELFKGPLYSSTEYLQSSSCKPGDKQAHQLSTGSSFNSFSSLKMPMIYVMKCFIYWYQLQKKPIKILLGAPYATASSGSIARSRASTCRSFASISFASTFFIRWAT